MYTCKNLFWYCCNCRNYAFIWTYVLGWLCDKGFTSISWFLVLLPYVLILLAMLGIYRATHEQRQFMIYIKLKGAYGQEAMTNGNPTPVKKN